MMPGSRGQGSVGHCTATNLRSRRDEEIVQKMVHLVPCHLP